MSNASNCRRAATRFERLATQSGDPEERRACETLARLWAEMAELAAHFDRERDNASKAQIYAMMEEVEAVRQKVA